LAEPGIEVKEAAILAARVNRLAGHYAKPSSATQVIEIIQRIPEALEKTFEGKKEKKEMKRDILTERKGAIINAEMTVLDVVSRYRQTEAVFKRYDREAGVCICCEALFEPISVVATRYGLPLKRLLADLETSASEEI